MIGARHAARVGDDDQVGASSPLSGFEKDDIAYGRDLPGDRIAQGGLRDRFAGPELYLDRVPETADDRYHLIRIVVDVANAGVLGPRNRGLRRERGVWRERDCRGTQNRERDEAVPHRPDAAPEAVLGAILRQHQLRRRR